MLVAWGVAALLGMSLTDQMRWHWSAAAWIVLATVPLTAWLWWLTHARWGPIARLRDVVRKSVIPLFADVSPLGLAAISLVAGIGEEALFRGVLLDTLADPLGTAGAVLLTSVLFGLAHAISRTYAILAGLIGCYLGSLLLLTDNLLVPMGVHALYDFVALMYLVRYGRRAADASQVL